uniref:Polyprotein protein n=1 Tax=Solanum tuberosum TaxID=4113 RepID=M1DFF8_SOLTU
MTTGRGKARGVALAWWEMLQIVGATVPKFMGTTTSRGALDACQSRQGELSEVMAFKEDVADMSKDVDYLKSTDFNSLIGKADDLDAPEIPINTGDVQRDATTDEESEAETNEEQMTVHDDEMIEIQKESIFRNLPDLVETIMQ